MSSGTPLLDPASQTRARSSSHIVEETHQQYGFWVGVCFTINYIVGVGILEVPYAFKEAGIVFGVTVTFLSCLFITVSALYVVEASARGLGWAAVIFAEEIRSHHITSTPIPSDQAIKVVRADRLMDDSDSDSEEDATSGLLADHKTHVHELRAALRLPQREMQGMIDNYEMATPHLNHARRRDPNDHFAPPALGDAAGIPRNKQVSYDFEHDSLKKGFKDVGYKLMELNELLDIFSPMWSKVMYELALFTMLLMALWYSFSLSFFSFLLCDSIFPLSLFLFLLFSSCVCVRVLFISMP